MAQEASNVMLAQTWEEKIDPAGWWMSEKLDGIRAYWSGTTLYSRNGNTFVAPDYWKKDLPAVALDGELWCGHATFSKCMSIVKKSTNLVPEEWKAVIFLVFDAPKHGGTYEDRMAYLQKISKGRKYMKLVGFTKCKGKDHLMKMTKLVTNKYGGEGIMLRQPKSPYEWKRLGPIAC